MTFKRSFTFRRQSKVFEPLKTLKTYGVLEVFRKSVEILQKSKKKKSGYKKSSEYGSYSKRIQDISPLKLKKNEFGL